MGSLIVPAGVARRRQAQIVEQRSRGYGLGEMKHDEDPSKKILRQVGMTKLGVLPGFELFGNRVLVAIYERPDTLKSGIVISDQTRREDEHQSKAAMVLMKGPTAFVSDDRFDFLGQNVEPGEWCAVFISDGRKIVVNTQLCRIVRDQDITLKIPAPDAVY